LALFLVGGFDVEVDQFLAVDNGDAEFLRLRRVEQHTFHFLPLREARPGGDKPRRGRVAAAMLAGDQAACLFVSLNG
ncbi:MAG TPA: hypothetical protein PLL19_03415, partial [Thiobacillaceae bacterium]|nr:hypothetical protein [Thiobacillaceae bacterium]